MAKERAFNYRNIGKDNEPPIWVKWFQKTVADAVYMSDADNETKTIVDYVNQKIADLIGGAPETFDTLKEIADYIEQHQNVVDAINAAIGNKVDKVTGKSLSTNDYTTAEKTKLAGIASNANNYVHPSNHPATIITEDATHRFVTDAEKATWNGKAGTAVATASANGLLSKEDKVKLDGVAAGANNYTHPSTHPATIISQDGTHRFATDTEKSSWNGKANVIFAEELPSSAPAGTLCFLI